MDRTRRRAGPGVRVVAAAAAVGRLAETEASGCAAGGRIGRKRSFARGAVGQVHGTIRGWVGIR
ncbi:hypothetical protein Psuf_044500 [Phytohabitans suffuscus]|uniref:Uncharacterized protein n=1 Tax=Phytohabitans suffuscus TaxID=624315 RepID=A0A6F8YM36_9ACTN|nr:hypothetical protein Psuf_044500 [Phytohabitans suffuscus]